MNTVEIARTLASKSGGGWIAAEAAKKLTDHAGVPIERLLLDLIPLASEFAQPATSGYKVGAIAQGVSGALFLGANCEFAGAELGQTVHAEQATVINAMQHGEPGLHRLAVSAPPCGYCRQFLYELADAKSLDIMLENEPPMKLTDYLPGAFGPGDLDVEGGLMAGPRRDFAIASGPEDDMAIVAVAAACRSYAPYTGSFAGVALQTSNGDKFSGSHLENAAFNPSVSALQSAAVAAVIADGALEETVRVVLARVEGSKLDHAAATAGLLKHFAPEARLEEVTLRER